MRKIVNIVEYHENITQGRLRVTIELPVIFWKPVKRVLNNLNKKKKYQHIARKLKNEGA